METNLLKQHWRLRSDAELRAALDELSDYDEDAREIIQEKAHRRSIHPSPPPVLETPLAQPETRGEAEDAPKGRRNWAYLDLAGFLFLALLAGYAALPGLTRILDLLRRSNFSALLEAPMQLLWTGAMIGLFLYSVKRIRNIVGHLRR
jgi:hypothetical protein